eukprot:1614704-Rhodomonas_salina.1
MDIDARRWGLTEIGGDWRRLAEIGGDWRRLAEIDVRCGGAGPHDVDDELLRVVERAVAPAG